MLEASPNGKVVGFDISEESVRKAKKINKTFRFTEPGEQFRHENYLPAIIPRELWEQVQMLLNERKEKNVRAAQKREILRYSGLLRCADCGRTLIGKRLKQNGIEQVQYVCDTYHRYGKEHCPSHKVMEKDLDKLLVKELRSTKRMYQQNWDELSSLIEKWNPKESIAEEKVKKLRKQVVTLEDEVEAILMERIRDKANMERYDRMIAKREAEIDAIKKQIEELQNIAVVIRERQAKLKRDISLIDDILKEGNLTEAQLRLLVERIYVHEKNGKISLDIRMKAPFRDHLDIYEDGEQTECCPSLDYNYERLGAILMEDYLDGEEDDDTIAG